MARSPEEWRRRLHGQLAFDPPAAEAAIRRAYQASGLPEPDRVFWARGPREAAETIRFLGKPPRRQRRLGFGLLLVGALAWPALALSIVDPRAPEDPVNAITLVGAVAAFYLLRAAGRALPAPPGGDSARPRRAARVLALIAIFVAMMGVLLAARPLWQAGDEPARAGMLAMSSAAGALPGTLLLLRLRRRYGHLPGPLQTIAAGRSVAHRLRRARAAARPPFPRAPAAARPDPSLLRAYRSAYDQAFRLDVPPFERGDRLRPGHPGESVWMMPGSVRSLDPMLFHPVPAHLDGIEDGELAAAPRRQGADGPDAFDDLAYRVDRCFPFRRVAVAVRPATLVRLDAEGRPHSEEGPALAWADGTEVHAWRGRVVDEDLLDPRIPLTLARIRREIDHDRRWVLIERYGLGRFLTETSASEVHHDACGTLYRLEEPGEPLVAVRVVNHTPEPDGRFAEFWLRVPPTMRTAREAVAWTFGLSADEYDPAAQS